MFTLPTLQGTWDSLRRWLDAYITTPLSQAWSRLTGGLRDVWESVYRIPQALRAAWDGVKTRILKAFQAVLPLFEQWYDRIKEEITSWLSDTVSWVRSIRDIVTAFFQGAGQFWLEVYHKVRDTAYSLLYYTRDFLREHFIRAVDWATDYIIWCVITYVNRIW